MFECIALSRDKRGIATLAQKGQTIETSKDILKDPYVFEFLDISEHTNMGERSLENVLIEKVGHFQPAFCVQVSALFAG